jgi:hypothetical protein
MSQTVETLLRRNLHDVFGEHDAARRRRAIDEVFTEDCVFISRTGRYDGRAALDAAVAALHARLPGLVFKEISLQALDETGRLQWGLGQPGSPPQATGLDVVLVHEGKIAALYVFLDPPKETE